MPKRKAASKKEPPPKRKPGPTKEIVPCVVQPTRAPSMRIAARRAALPTVAPSKQAPPVKASVRNALAKSVIEDEAVVEKATVEKLPAERSPATNAPRRGRPPKGAHFPEKIPAKRVTVPTRKTLTRKEPCNKEPGRSLEVLKPVLPKRTTQRKTPRVESIRFETTDSDPIIENLREVSARYQQIRNINHEVLDHVALEGLTGITFRRLCLILDSVIPNFNSCSEDKPQDHLWSIIVQYYMRRVPGARIQAFYLDLNETAKSAEMPEDESLVDPSKHFCIDKAIQLPTQSLKRIAKSDWMLHPVLDGQIMGSCPNYTRRRDISLELMELFDQLGARESLLDTHADYNLDNVFFVAEQEMRRRALLPASADPNMDMKLREYACLELIGRTRCFGIVFPNDKTLGRYRILLTAKGLITQYQQTCNTFIIHHLRRFSKYNLESAMKAFKGGLGMAIKTRPVTSCDDEDDDELQENGRQATVRNTCCQPARLRSDRDILRMVYDTIAMSRGRSMCDIRRKLRLPKSHVRNHLKNLANTGLIGSHTRIILDKKTRIYRARHRSKRRTIARQKKIMRGVKAKWDETDLRAREMLGLRRSQFSQAEDSLLTLCRITGLLMDPTYPKSFIVSKLIIRDILHDELFESHDKTSDSLLRRMKYLRRLPSNVALINEMTAELRDDQDIRRLIEGNKDISKSDDKLIQYFKQLLRAIRAKLPHLLGLTSSLVAGSSSIEIENYEDLTNRFELIDCRENLAKKVYHQPPCTLVQLVRSTPQCYRLKVAKCEDMNTIMLITSRCVQTCFNLTLKLRVPVRVVSLDQDNEFFKDIFEKARENKEACRMIANLTTPNPTADSRRALFMLRNALKLQTMDKCGKLADALVIQPCDIEFSSKDEISFGWRDVIRDFLDNSKFSNEIRVEARNNDRESVNKRRREKDQQRRQARANGDKKLGERTSMAKAPATPATKRTSPTRAAKPTGGLSTAGSGDQPSTSQSANSNSIKMQTEPKSPLTKQEKLFKMIESIMSWISSYPGIELESLKKNLTPLFGGDCAVDEHLRELLELMETLELVARDCIPLTPDMCQKPLLFGYRKLTSVDVEQAPIITFEPRENAYVRLSQLIDVEL